LLTPAGSQGYSANSDGTGADQIIRLQNLTSGDVTKEGTRVLFKCTLHNNRDRILVYGQAGNPPTYLGQLVNGFAPQYTNFQGLQTTTSTGVILDFNGATCSFVWSEGNRIWLYDPLYCGFNDDTVFAASAINLQPANSLSGSSGAPVSIVGGNTNNSADTGGNVFIHAGNQGGANPGGIFVTGLPTSDPGHSGQLFTLAGVLHVSP
jgi:hypothetical protein